MHLDPTTQTDLARQRATQLRETMLAARRHRSRPSVAHIQSSIDVGRVFQTRPAARRAAA